MTVDHRVTGTAVGKSQLSWDLLALRDPQAWKTRGTCTQIDPEVFFTEAKDVPKAKAACIDCPVTEECLQYALENDERYGVWGGLGPAERRRIQRNKEKR